MHPAYSIILFTTASGAGYGLLALMCLFGALGLLPADLWLGLIGFGLGFALVTGGLLSSTLHLGHPERAWRAVTQWRSSWLSREGVMALIAYVPTGIFALGWVVFGETGGAWAVAGLLGAVCCAATVWCTAMIYASLPTIRAWHDRWVLPGYLVLALASGAVLLSLLATLFGAAQPIFFMLAAAALWAGAVVKHGYWRSLDRAPRDRTTAQAIGLPDSARVRPLDPPHTQANYVMREMGFEVARKHALKLRRIALIAGFVLPLVLTLLALPLGGGLLAGTALVLAVAAMVLGLLVERWLFFAEAQHVVTLYYGAEAA